MSKRGCTWTKSKYSQLYIYRDIARKINVHVTHSFAGPASDYLLPRHLPVKVFLALVIIYTLSNQRTWPQSLLPNHDAGRGSYSVRELGATLHKLRYGVFFTVSDWDVIPYILCLISWGGWNLRITPVSGFIVHSRPARVHHMHILGRHKHK